MKKMIYKICDYKDNLDDVQTEMSQLFQTNLKESEEFEFKIDEVKKKGTLIIPLEIIDNEQKCVRRKQNSTSKRAGKRKGVGE